MNGVLVEDSKEVQTESLEITATPLPNGLVKVKTGANTDDTVYNNWYQSVYQSSAPDTFSLELFEDISYIMAKHADSQGVPDTPDEWLDQFGTFSIYQVLPEIIELWGLNVQTQEESKKNFDRLTGK